MLLPGGLSSPHITPPSSYQHRESGGTRVPHFGGHTQPRKSSKPPGWCCSPTSPFVRDPHPQIRLGDAGGEAWVSIHPPAPWPRLPRTGSASSFLTSGAVSRFSIPCGTSASL